MNAHDQLANCRQAVRAVDKEIIMLRVSGLCRSDWRGDIQTDRSGIEFHNYRTDCFCIKKNAQCTPQSKCRLLNGH